MFGLRITWFGGGEFDTPREFKTWEQAKAKADKLRREGSLLGFQIASVSIIQPTRWPPPHCRPSKHCKVCGII